MNVKGIMNLQSTRESLPMDCETSCAVLHRGFSDEDKEEARVSVLTFLKGNFSFEQVKRVEVY